MANLLDRYLSRKAAVDRQRIVRLLIDRVVIHVEKSSDRVDVALHWTGGFTSQHELLRPVAGYNKMADYDRMVDRIEGLRRGPKLEAGKHTIAFDFKYDGPGFGKGGTGTLTADGKEVAKKTLENTVPITFPEDETFDIGMDTRTPVSLIEYHYECPFKFTGKINRLTFTLGPHEYTADKKVEKPQ